MIIWNAFYIKKIDFVLMKHFLGLVHDVYQDTDVCLVADWIQPVISLCLLLNRNVKCNHLCIMYNVFHCLVLINHVFANMFSDPLPSSIAH